MCNILEDNALVMAMDVAFFFGLLLFVHKVRFWSIVIVMYMIYVDMDSTLKTSTKYWIEGPL